MARASRLWLTRKIRVSPDEENCLTFSLTCDSILALQTLTARKDRSPGCHWLERIKSDEIGVVGPAGE